MRERRCNGASRRKWITTTVRDETAKVSSDLVKRNFTASLPNQLWVADITYVPTHAGFLFLAVVMDVCSRRVVGLVDGKSYAPKNSSSMRSIWRSIVANRRPSCIIPIMDRSIRRSLLANDVEMPA